MLLASSDHVFPDDEAFRRAVHAAEPRALAGDFVHLGIVLDKAETAFGHLESAAGADPQANPPQALASFIEKPNAHQAAEMLASGNYLWNAGIILFKTETCSPACQQHAPDVLLPRALLHLSWVLHDSVAIRGRKSQASRSIMPLCSTRLTLLSSLQGGLVRSRGMGYGLAGERTKQFRQCSLVERYSNWLLQHLAALGKPAN
mgnify:CR=1 FL=1